MENKELAFIKGNLENTDRNKELLDTSFLSSNDITVIENGIYALVKSANKIQLTICLSLYKIESEGLYQQLGYGSFSSYVSKERNIPKPTAWEYYYIGKYWIELKEELDQIGFTEEDGLSKLKFFPKKLNVKHKELVLEHLKNDSARQFKQFVTSLKGTDVKKINDSKNLTIMDSELLLSEAIEYIRLKSKNSNTTKLAQLEGVKGFIEYLVERKKVDKKHYNAMLEAIK